MVDGSWIPLTLVSTTLQDSDAFNELLPLGNITQTAASNSQVRRYFVRSDTPTETDMTAIWYNQTNPTQPMARHALGTDSDSYIRPKRMDNPAAFALWARRSRLFVCIRPYMKKVAV